MRDRSIPLPLLDRSPDQVVRGYRPIMTAYQGLLSEAQLWQFASLKMLLVVLFFMHLRFHKPLTRLFAGAGLTWVIILIGLTIADVATRGWIRPAVKIVPTYEEPAAEVGSQPPVACREDCRQRLS